MTTLFRAFAPVALAATLLAPSVVTAQGYFVPNQPQQGRPAPARPPQGTPARPPQPVPAPAPAMEAEQAPIQAPMPPVPDLPPLPKVDPPPAPIVGVIGVRDVMRALTAAQQVDRIIGERRDKLNDDAQKEQQAWRDLQQALANQRGSLSPDQIRAKEKELQDRITNAQRSFQNRSRIIQEAAQYGLNQIQASLIAVIRQVAESHGMNIVLHRDQVALNVSDYDISEQVVEQLNKLLPSVTIPPDGVSPNPPPQAASPTPPTPAAPAAAPPKKP